MEIVGVIMENSSIILLLIAFAFAVAARIFQKQRNAIQAAQVATKEFVVESMESLEDWVVTEPELNEMVVKFEEMKESFVNLYEAFQADQEPEGIIEAIFPKPRTDQILSTARAGVRERLKPKGGQK
jgi:hypothetical protein